MSSNLSNITNDRNDDATKGVTSFDDNGFTLGNWDNVNANNDTYVAWNWKALDHDKNLPAINTNGTIPSLVSANTAAGFSVVKYFGNTTAGATVGHGLSAKPELIFIKNLDQQIHWIAYDTNINNVGYLSYTDAFATSRLSWGFNSTAPTTKTVTLGYNGQAAVNGSDHYIMYLWHSVAGHSKIGSYEGDGTNDYSKEITGLGFDPSFVMVKNVDSNGSNWEMIDTSRGDEKNLYANENYSENANSEASYGSGKFITDGFEVARGSVSSSLHWNKSGDTYIYMAFK